jgi:LytS/YehU family sensor histidine kinase
MFYRILSINNPALKGRGIKPLNTNKTIEHLTVCCIFVAVFAEKKLTESRISIMLSQIRPYFLYNALAVISRLCDRDPSEAEKVTVNFSNYLRANMNLLERTEPIPFENELNHTIEFMNLEKAMYGEALNVIYNIQAKGFKLPALTMQPRSDKIRWAEINCAYLQNKMK